MKLAQLSGRQKLMIKNRELHDTVLAQRFGMTPKHISRIRAAMLAEEKDKASAKSQCETLPVLR